MRFVILMILTMMASTVSAQNAQTPPRGDAENGKKIFASYGCYQCHNYAANGGGAGPRLAPRPVAFPAFLRAIRTPRDQMPPYSTKMVTDQELADIYAFLLSIPPAPAVDSIPALRN